MKNINFRVDEGLAYDLRVALAKRDISMQEALTKLVQEFIDETNELEAAGKLRPHE